MQSILQGWRVTPPLRAGHLHKLFAIPLQMRFVSILPFVYLFHHLLESVCAHRYLFYTLGYNPILLYFVTQIVPALTTCNFSKIGSCVPVTYPTTNMWLFFACLFFNFSFVSFSEYVLFLALQDDLGSSYIFCHLKNKKNPCTLPIWHPLPQKKNKTLIITGLLVITIFFPFQGCHIGA